MTHARLVVGSIFSLILLAMLAATTWASLDRSIFKVGAALLTDRWFHATLLDAYCGFVTFYVWLAWREARWSVRLGWFVAIMLLGNIAMSTYVLAATIKLGSTFSMSRLLIGRHAEGGTP